MKTAIFSLVLGFAAYGVAGPMAERSSSPVLGGAILLDNDQLIEGQIHREGNLIVIRRGTSETSLPSNRVAEIVANRKAALQFMRERTNRRDPDERYRLIHWCMQNGLREEAIQEAEQFLKLRPQDARLQELLRGIKELKTTVAVPQSDPAKRATGGVVEIDPLDYNTESYGVFAARVQPILMNVCISCHANGKGGGYSLVRADAMGNRNATNLNLAATLKYLNRNRPLESILLSSAVTAHGKSPRPPLRDRQHPAYIQLENWVQLALPPGESEPKSVEPVFETKAPQTNSKPAGAFGEISKSKPLAEPQTEAKDPFDPAIFNGTIQPKK